MFKKILVPFTGSALTKRAFNVAIEIAKKNNSNITVLSCVEKYYTFGFETGYDKKVSENHKHVIQKQIEQLKKVAEKNGVSFQSKIIKSNFPQKCILTHINEKNIDLVILGKTEMLPAEQYHHQSTINYVYPKANCPVLIIK